MTNADPTQSAVVYQHPPDKHSHTCGCFCLASQTSTRERQGEVDEDRLPRRCDYAVFCHTDPPPAVMVRCL